MRKLEIEGDRFWEIWTEDLTVKFRFGKVGAKGQLKLKKLGTKELVAMEVDRLVAAKLKEGFVEVGGAAAPAKAKPKEAPKVETKPAKVEAKPAPKNRASCALTEGLKAAVFPRRTPRKTAEKLDVDALRKTLTTAAKQYWKENRAYFKKQKSERVREWATLYETLVEHIAKKTKLDIDEEAAHWAITHDDEELARYWVGAMGAEFAVRAYVRAWRFDPWGHHLSIDSELVGRDNAREVVALRNALLLAADADYAKAKRVAAEVRASAPLPLRCSLSFVMDDVEWASADALEFATALENEKEHVLRRSPKIGSCLIAVVRDRDVALTLAKAIRKRRHFVMGRYSANDGYLETFLENLGADALEPLGVLFEGATGDREGPAEGIAKLIACIDGLEAARLLVRHLEHKAVRPIALAYGAAHPVVAAAALAEAAVSRSKNADSAKRALAELGRAKNVAASAAKLVGPTERALLESLGSANVEEASAKDLPSVLASPPWLGKRVAKPSASITGLKDLPFKETIEWEKGEKERALDQSSMEGLLRNWGNLPKPNVKRRTKGIDEHVAKALKKAKAGTSWFDRVHYVAGVLDAMTDEGALAAWNDSPAQTFTTGDDDLRYLIARFGYDAFPGLIAAAETWPQKGVPELSRLVSPRVAPLMADAARRLKKVAPIAKKWLAKHSEPAAIALLPRAFSGAGKERDAAMAALRHLDPAVARKVADRYGKETRTALDAILAFDPLHDLPAKIPPLPGWLKVEGLARPVLKKSKKALPLEATRHLVTMLALGMPDYPGIAMVKESCEARSLGELAWDLFLAWNLANGPSKEDWALTSLGVFGDDECARRLAPRIREWPGEGGHARAVKGLDVLAEIGSDIALMHLDGIAQKVKFKGLQEKARAKIEEVAEARGLSREELGDRLVPDFDLEPDGSKTLSFGARSFKLRFDEKLVPFVVDDAGKRLPDLPKPGKTDDASIAGESVAFFKTLKKDAKTVAQNQLLRLERAMCMRRRWDTATFRTFFIEHPLVVRAMRSLVLGIYGKKLVCFRIAEDGTLANLEDEPFEFPENASIGIVHRLEMDEKDRVAWSGVFADYEILPSFPQLDRETFALTAQEAKATSTDRFKGKKVPLGKVLGLEGRGWRRGTPQDAGWIWDMVKPIGDDLEATLHLDGGILAGDMRESPAEQGLEAITLREKSSWKESKLGFGKLDPILASELLRDVAMTLV